MIAEKKTLCYSSNIKKIESKKILLDMLERHLYKYGYKNKVLE